MLDIHRVPRHGLDMNINFIHTISQLLVEQSSKSINKSKYSNNNSCTPIEIPLDTQYQESLHQYISLEDKHE